MEINYKDTFYNFIEAFIYIAKPTNPLNELGVSTLDDKSKKLYNSLNRTTLDYETSSMIILEGKYFSDLAYLYYFPIIVKNIIENNGLIEAIILRLKQIDVSKFEELQQQNIATMIETLSELKVKMDNYHDDFILVI